MHGFTKDMAAISARCPTRDASVMLAGHNTKDRVQEDIEASAGTKCGFEKLVLERIIVSWVCQTPIARKLVGVLPMARGELLVVRWQAIAPRLVHLSTQSCNLHSLPGLQTEVAIRYMSLETLRCGSSSAPIIQNRGV